MPGPRCCGLPFLFLLGCTTHPVMLVAPGEPPGGNCFEACQAVFGARPTLNCGEREGPPRTLVCSYDAWASSDAGASGSCQAECERAGLRGVEACFPLTTAAGAPAVGCQYRVGYH
jgi:hypothetical protein